MEEVVSNEQLLQQQVSVLEQIIEQMSNQLADHETRIDALENPFRTSRDEASVAPSRVVVPKDKTTAVVYFPNRATDGKFGNAVVKKLTRLGFRVVAQGGHWLFWVATNADLDGKPIEEIDEQTPFRNSEGQEVALILIETGDQITPSTLPNLTIYRFDPQRREFLEIQPTPRGADVAPSPPPPPKKASVVVPKQQQPPMKPPKAQRDLPLNSIALYNDVRKTERGTKQKRDVRSDAKFKPIEEELKRLGVRGKARLR